MAQQNGIIIFYTINVTVADSGEMFQLTSTTTSLTVSTLQPFTTYFCIIAASTSVGMGPFSTVVTFQTPEDGMLLCMRLYTPRIVRCTNLHLHGMSLCQGTRDLLSNGHLHGPYNMIYSVVIIALPWYQ